MLSLDFTSPFAGVWKRAIGGFALGEGSLHGPAHWRRVHYNALEIVRGTGAGDLDVVRLFAALHDCRRENESHDPEHGQRAADWARIIRGELFDLDAARFELLEYALIWHDKGRVSSDPTIGACWDADRMDLPRVGIDPDPRLLSTGYARTLIRLPRRCAPGNDTPARDRAHSGGMSRSSPSQAKPQPTTFGHCPGP